MYVVVLDKHGGKMVPIGNTSEALHYVRVRE
jgi:hypothetical protein